MSTLGKKRLKEELDFIEEAPTDGNQYARKDGSWEEVAAGTFSGTMDDITDGSTYVKTENNLTDTLVSEIGSALQDASAFAPALGVDDNYVTDTEKSNLHAPHSDDQVIPDELSDLSDDATHRLVTDTEKSSWNDKQDALGITPEDVLNKSTNVITDGTSDTKYPSVKAIKDYADGLVVGLVDDRGNYDASGNIFPSTGGSGVAGVILKGDLWYISVAGTLGGVAVSVGSSLRALANAPGQTAGNWDILNVGLGFVPENSANRETSALDTSTTKYPCNNVVKGAVEGRLDKTTADGYYEPIYTKFILSSDLISIEPQVNTTILINISGHPVNGIIYFNLDKTDGIKVIVKVINIVEGADVTIDSGDKLNGGDPNIVLTDADIGFTEIFIFDSTSNCWYEVSKYTANNYTTTEKTKLSGIQENAEVNVNADWNSNTGDSQILNKLTAYAEMVTMAAAMSL